MASIKQRPDGKWRARYRDRAGKEHAKHFDRKRDAQQWLDEVTTSVVTGQYVSPNAGRIMFRIYAEAWLNAQVNRDGTADVYRRHMRRHAYPVIGDMRLSDILPSTIQAWVKGLTVGIGDERAPLSPSTVGVVYTIAATIFRAAVSDRKIATTPCINIKLPEVSKTRVNPLTTAQLLLLTGAVPDELKALVTFTASTGMRQGEVLGLTRDRLRLLGKNPAVTVDRQLVTRKGGDTDFGRLKTNASYRTIPLPYTAIDALNTHIATYKVGESDLLFTDALKRPYTRQRFGHAWRPAASKAGLNDDTGTGMHALRHYYASLLIRYGESVKTVQDRLGHKSAAETLDTYSHLWEDSDDRTRDAVDSVLRNLEVSADSLRTGHA